MEFQTLLQRALEVRQQYAAWETSRYGRAWTREEVVQGFVGDVGDLVKLTMACSGIRDIPDAKKKLAHELGDCLWSLLVIAQLYGVNLEKAFVQAMAELEQQLKKEMFEQYFGVEDQEHGA